MFDSPSRLLLGLAAGVVFGFLLQKGRVTKYDVIVKQFLFRDFTVVKTMVTAMIVGGFGVYALHSLGWVNLHIKPALLLTTAVGGLIFGIGMALLGFCPGTGIGAAAEGNRHVRWGLLGMLAGAGAYAEAHAAISASLSGIWNLGKATLPGITGVGPFWILLAISALAAVLFLAPRHRESRGARTG